MGKLQHASFSSKQHVHLSLDNKNSYGFKILFVGISDKSTAKC